MPPPISSASKWYYALQGQQQGPVSLHALIQLIQARQISSIDRVWRDGLTDWQPAGAMPELQHLFIQYQSPTVEDIGQSAGIRMLLPVGRSGWAIAAGYLGLFSFVIFPAPISLIVSIIAIWDIRRDKSKHGMGRAIFGLVTGLLGSIVLVFVIFAMLMSHK